MAAKSPDPRAPPLARIVLGYFYLVALRAVAELGIADLLADGLRSPQELAEATVTSPSHLHRALRALAGCGVFAQDTDGQHRLTATASRLRRDHESSLRDQVWAAAMAGS